MIETTTAPRIPAAVLTDADVLQAAVEALQEQDRLRLAQRALDDHLRVLCRQMGAVSGYWGLAPHHLRQMCRARGLL